MSKPKRGQENFTPDHLGEKENASKSNKGEQMADKTRQHPDVIQTKGE